LRAWAVVLAVAAVALQGCGARDAEVRRLRGAAEHRSLAASLDRMEERLVASKARVAFWQEMRDRHESVSAIACGAQERQAEEMAQHDVDADAPDLEVGPARMARWTPTERPPAHRAASRAGAPAPPDHVPASFRPTGRGGGE